MSGYPGQQYTTYQPHHHHDHHAAPEMAPQTPLMHSDMEKGAHAHVSRGPEWENGFCSCCSPLGTCCLGAWCPCILYGRTYHRLENNGSTSGYSCCNSRCMFYGCLVLCTPMQTFLGYFQRKKIREKFGLSGGCCGDCLRHCCCSCCALIQEEKEVIAKTKSTGYQASGGMHYPK